MCSRVVYRARLLPLVIQQAGDEDDDDAVTTADEDNDSKESAVKRNRLCECVNKFAIASTAPANTSSYCLLNKSRICMFMTRCCTMQLAVALQFDVAAQ